jgi:hypothetical protein
MFIQFILLIFCWLFTGVHMRKSDGNPRPVEENTSTMQGEETSK